MPPSHIAWKLLIAEDDKHGSLRLRNKRHPGFKEHVRASLQPATRLDRLLGRVVQAADVQNDRLRNR